MTDTEILAAIEKYIEDCLDMEENSVLDRLQAMIKEWHERADPA
jgi:hypothetical protein